MKKSLRALAILLSCCMSLSLLACHPEDDDESSTTSASPQQEETVTSNNEPSSDKETEAPTEVPTEVVTDNGGTSSDETSDETETDPAPSVEGDTGGLELPLTHDNVEIEIYVGTSVTDMDVKLFDQALEERTGLTLTWQTFPLESYGEKIRSILGTGVAPDIHAGGVLSQSEINDLGEQGAFAKINEHYDLLPNFRSLYLENEDNDWFTYSYSSNAGNLFVWPMYGRSRDVNHGFMYRADVLRDLGVEPWTNQEEFYEVLKAIKEAYPESYPVVSKYKEKIFAEWAAYWGIGNSTHYPFHYDERDSGAWRFFGTDPKYLDMLDFMKKLYDEGLLDPEFLTDDQDPWSEKITNDRGFVFYDWIGRMPLFNTQMRETDEHWDLRFGFPIGPTGECKSIPKILTWGPVVGNNEKAKYALQLLDYLTSPEGATLNTVGMEGVNFEWEGDEPVYRDLDTPLVSIDQLEEEYGLWLQGLYVRTDPRSVYFNYSEEEQEAQDIIVDHDLLMDLEPEIKLSDEESAELSDIQTQLIDELTTFSSNYVMAGADYDDFVARVEALNVSHYEDILNEAQARFDEAVR